MSLKDALLKAGIKSSKNENERAKPKSIKSNTEKHQQSRNFCEVCELIHPDVERFKHRIPLLDAQWICLSCADKEMVHDKFRVSAQSQFAKQGRYLREYGPTLKPEDNKNQSKPTHKQGHKKPRRPQQGLNDKFVKSRNFNRDEAENDDNRGNRGNSRGNHRGNSNNNRHRANTKDKNFNR